MIFRICFATLLLASPVGMAQNFGFDVIVPRILAERGIRAPRVVDTLKKKEKRKRGQEREARSRGDRGREQRARREADYARTVWQRLSEGGG